MWMKATNPKSAQWLNHWWHDDSTMPKKLFFDLFMLLFCFVTLQVIVKGSW
jgi:hypothetical protein